MKKKLKMLLSKLRDSKFFKIFFSTFLIFGVLLSCVVVPSSAADVEPQSDIPTDLTGYRIEVPAGWSCYAGWGIFDITYTYYFPVTGLYGSDIYDQFAVGVSPSSQVNTYFSLMANRVCGRYVSSGRYSGTRNSNDHISILVSGGVDVSNTRFINWLVDNNAVFTLVNPPSDSFNPDVQDFSYQSIAPIYFSEFSGDITAVAFPGAHTLILNYNGTTNRNYLDHSDYTEYPDIIKTSIIDDVEVPYIQIYLKCNYPSVYVNSVMYSGSFSSSTITSTLSGVTSFDVYPVEHSYSPGVTYYYTWNILLGDYFNENDVFQAGFNEGVNSQIAKDKYFNEGYDLGLSDGLNSSASSSLGSNLLGETLSAPMTALNSFVLYTTPSGVPISLGLVLGSVIALTFFIAFLKLFAGG